MQSMGELSHAQANPFQDSFEACQGDYSRSARSSIQLRYDSHHRPYHSLFRSVMLDYPTGREQRHGAIHD